MERRISGRSSGCVRGGEKGWDEEEVKGRGSGVRDWKTEGADRKLGVDEDKEQLRWVTLDLRISSVCLRVSATWKLTS